MRARAGCRCARAGRRCCRLKILTQAALRYKTEARYVANRAAGATAQVRLHDGRLTRE
jgi:hypothetical protein